MTAPARPRTGSAYLDDVLEIPYGPLAIAHRGGAKIPDLRGAENTLRAFRHAVDLGYRYLETDVHASRDGVLFAFHDSSVERLTRMAGQICDLTAGDIGALDVEGEVIPRFVDLLEAFPDARFNIDIKARAATPLLAELLARTRANDRCCVASFSDERIREFRRLTHGRVTTGAARTEITRFLAEPARRADAYRRRAGFSVLQLPVRLRGLPVIRPWVVRRAHAAGVHVHAWTVDDAATITEMIDLGIDGIFTDRTDVLKDVLSARNAWRERL